MNSVYNSKVVQDLIEEIGAQNGIADKAKLTKYIVKTFALIRDRAVYYNQDFAIRFSSSKYNSANFGNTVLSLSTLQKYDKKPFFVCLVTPNKNYMFLTNTTFLNKISHSSQELTPNNIKGSFNGTNIIRDWCGIKNCPENFEILFNSHENYSFEENLTRLVEATNQITPNGRKFIPNQTEKQCIFEAVDRAKEFLASPEYEILNDDLNLRTKSVKDQIIIASLIENVNLRGRCIEYLITADEDDNFKDMVIDALNDRKPLPPLFTDDELGDYNRDFINNKVPVYRTKTDIKTKVLFLSSQPKGYNIDKLLSFLATEKSVYLIYIVAIGNNKDANNEKDKEISTCLCSIFDKQLLEGTRIIPHWAGRNSRGVTQYNGKSLENIVENFGLVNFDREINSEKAKEFLKKCLEETKE